MQDLYLYDLEGEEDELSAETDAPAEVDEEEDFSDFASANDEE
ncbi:MAG: hypothetical protein WC587_01045 [Candidatus Paceibacterota bacterium]